ncbi:hypothetical protein [Corynebacterium heidelbergense]|nr:hypothetical protein [Corynebacterium heidelbergense]WCZ35762.1 hypothetical protein CHEID_00915 [Corynebacterium heidelbergense]
MTGQGWGSNIEPPTQFDARPSGLGNPFPGGNAPKQGGLAKRIFIVGVSVALTVVLAILGYFWWQSRDHGAQPNEMAQPTFQAAPASTTASSSSSAAPAPSPAPNVPSPNVQAAPAPAPNRPGSLDEFGAGMDTTDDQISPGGWVGISGAHCNADDQWVYAASNGTDRAVVCRVGANGGLYYRGLYKGGEAERDIASGTEGSYRTISDGGTVIVISPKKISVENSSGAELSQVELTEFHFKLDQPESFD